MSEIPSALATRTGDAPDAPLLSVVVPIYDEEENLRPLHQALTEALRSFGSRCEIIFVDDGSRDRSFALAAEIARDDPRVRVLRLRRNSGQTAAMAAGIAEAAGEIIVPIDADLQNDPVDIERLVAKLGEGYDVVSGWRKERQDGGLTRRIPSRVANWLISRMTGVALHDYGCSLKAYRADVVKRLRLYGEMHRFIPAYAALEGAAVTEIPVRHHPRRAGRSKYGLSRTLKVILDLLVLKFLGTFGTRPIHFFGTTGAALCLAGILAALETLWERFLYSGHTWVHNNPFILLAVFLFLAGVQLIMMGLLAEIGIRTFHEAAGRAPYSIRERVGGGKRGSLDR